MKNFTRILIAASLILMVSSNSYSQDVFKTANVGIGTVNPQQKLDVAGNVKFSEALMPNGFPGSTGYILLSAGANTAPTWLPTGTSGTVLVANSAGIPTWSSANGLLTTYNVVNGGINSAVVVTNGIGQVVGSGNVALDVQGILNGVLYGQGTGSSAIFTIAGTNGQVLEAGATGIPTWTTPSLTAGWALAGNSIASTASFLGTTDATPLTFRVNNVQAGRLDIGATTANTYLGYGSGGPSGDGGIYEVGIGLYALGSEAAGGWGANVAVGAYSYPSATEGDWNVSIGTYSQYSASFNNSTAGYNVSVGAFSMYSNSTGASTVAGSYNTAIGYQSMYGNPSSPSPYGVYNVALGYNSLFNATGGGASSNTALGSWALYSGAGVGGKNTAVGDSSLYSNAGGEYNTGLGYQSNVASGALTNATAIGYQATAPVSNSITLGNTSVTSLYLPGYSSAGALLYTAANTGLVAGVVPGAAGTILESNGTSAPSWVSVAGVNSVTGTPPIYITNPGTSPVVNIEGLPNNSDIWGVLYSAGSGASALFTPSPSAGGLVLQSNGTSAPTWVNPGATNAWSLAGNSIASTSFLGTTDGQPLVFKVNNAQAGRIDIPYQNNGIGNTYLGSWGVLGSTTYGSPGGPTGDAGTVNVAIGVSALGGYNIGGSSGNGAAACCGAMVAVGAFAYPGASGGEHSVAIGAYSQLDAAFAGAANSNGYTVSVGAYTLYSNSLGNYETAIGYQSMYGSGTATSYGNDNTALGTYSLYNITTGGSNTALGSSALYNTTAGRNTGVGDSALYSNTSGEYNTGVGYQSNVSSGALTNATAIGYQAVAGASNTLVLGNGAASVGINTSTPKQLLEIGGTANTIRVDGLGNAGTYNAQISANAGNIVYSNNSNGDLYSLPNPGVINGQVLSLTSAGVPTWNTLSSSIFTTYNITGNTGTSVVVGGGNLNSVVGSGNVTLDVQGTAGGVFYGNGLGTAAAFTTAGASGQVLQSNGTGVPTWVTPPAAPNAWSLTGNTGTVPGTNYLGTLDDNALYFGVNGHYAGSIDPLNNNYAAANVYLGSYGVLGSTTYGGAGNNDAGNANVGIGLAALGSAGGPQYVGGNTGGNTNGYNGGNTAVGVFTLANEVYGENNVAIGAYSQFYANWASEVFGFNTAAGSYSLYSNTTGQWNTALGYYSMFGSGSPTAYGNYNTALGYNSLYSPGNSASNTAIGSNALLNTTASRNTAVGDSALYSNITGTNNTALGYQANVSAGNLTNATAIGYGSSAIASNSITLGNSSVTSLYLPGYPAVGDLLYTSANTGLVGALTPGVAGTILESTGTSSVPTWISIAGVNSVTGTPPIYITGTATAPDVNVQGSIVYNDAGGVLYSAGSGNAAAFTPQPTAANLILTSTAGGGAPTWQSAAASATAWNLVGNAGTTSANFIGTTSAEPLMFRVANVNAGVIDNSLDNTNLGYGAGQGGASGTGDISGGNTAIGYEALYNNVGPGSQYVAVGAFSLYSAGTTTGGSAVVGIGYASGYYEGSLAFVQNTSVGAFSLYSDASGENETAVGYGSMYGTGTNTGSFGINNTAIGAWSLYNSTGGLGGSNTAVGTYSLYNSAGGRNAAVGDSALASNSSGEFNTAVGYQSLTSNTSGNYNTALGYSANVSSGSLSNATAIGAYAYVAQNNSMVLGAINGINGYTGTNTSVGIGTNAPNQALEVAPTTSTIRVDGLANGDTYNTQIAANAGNIVYTNNTTGDLYSLPNGANGTILTLNSNGVPSWASASASLTTYSITGNTGTSVVIVGGNLNSVVGSGNVSLDVQGTQGGVFYGNGVGTAAAFNSAGSTGQVLLSGGAGAPTWGSYNSALTTSSIVPGAGSSVVVTNGANQVVGASNVTVDVQGTAGGVFYGTGSGTAAAFTTAAAAGQVLESNGAGAPTWGTLTIPNAWLLTGNTTAPTYGTDFIGFTSAVSVANSEIEFVTNGQYAGVIDMSRSNIEFGRGAGGDSTAASYSAKAVTELEAIGAGAAESVTTGNPAMVAIGYDALHNFTAGTGEGNSLGNNAVGALALYSLTTGIPNNALGTSAGFNITTGGYNVSVGFASNYNQTSGSYNVAAGDSALYGGGGTGGTPATYVASYNTAVGVGSLAGIGTGVNGGTGGFYNTAIGVDAAEHTSTGNGNVAVGFQAGNANTTGYYNTVMGYQSNVSSGALTNATAIGYQAIAPVSNSITLGNSSVTSLYLPGYSAVGDILYTSAGSGLVGALTPGAAGTVLASNGSGLPPTWISIAGISSVTGTPPIYINGTASVPNVNIQGLNSNIGGVLYSAGAGTAAVFTPTPTATGLILMSNGSGAPTWGTLSAGNAWSLTGNSGTVPGTNFLGTTTDEGLVFWVNGAYAGSLDPLNTNYSAANAYLGSYGVLGSTTYGGAGNLDAGDNNVGIGLSALGRAGGPSYTGNGSNSTAGVISSNVAVGVFTLASAVYGSGNVALGAYSELFLNMPSSGTTSGNTAAGAYSLYSNSTGTYNTAIGYNSMYGSGSSTAVGNYNTALGYNALYTAGVGVASNTALGSNALLNTTASRNTAVGDSALYSNTSGTNNTAIGYQANVSSGTLTNATAIGYASSAPASNSITLGNSAVTSLYLPGYSAVGSILYTAAATGQVASLAPGSAGTILQSTGTNSVPTWISVAGINAVTGTPPIYINYPVSPSQPNVNIQGLPNNSDMGGVLYSLGSGTSALFTPTPTAANLILTSAGSGGAPTWQSAAASSTAWNLVGNAGTTSANFLGTTSNEPLIFKVNGGYAGDLDYTDNATILGYGAASNANTQYANGTASWAGAGSTIIGFEALYNLGGTTGPGATYVGAYALYNLTTAPGTSYDVAVGYATHYYPGPDNVANTSVGSFSLYSDAGSTATGSQEVALGYQSMFGTGTSSGIFGNSNVAIGYNSFFNPTGAQAGGNTAVGSWALYSGAGGGGRNTAVGDSSLYSNTTGEFNTGLGYQANVGSGSLTNATAIGYQAVAGASNTLVLGNGAAFVGINTSTPAQLLEIGGTANTIRVDGLKAAGTYNTQISANAGNIVYTSNSTGDLYSLPNGSTGTVLTLNASGVPTWGTVSYSGTTYAITGNAGTSVVVGGGNLNSVVGSGNVTLDVQGTAGGLFYGQGLGTSAVFSSAGATGQVLQSNGTSAPTWTSLATPANVWSTTGNSGIVYGTNYIGSTTSSPLEFEVNSTYAGVLDATHLNVYFGGANAGNDAASLEAGGVVNVGIGWGALASVAGASGAATSGHVAIGAYALNHFAQLTQTEEGSIGNGTVAVGAYSLYSLTTPTGANTALGYASGYSLTTGNYNTSLGFAANYYNQTGYGNLAVGDSALWGGYAGSGALYSATGNTALGVSALSAIQSNGNYNTALGYEAAIHNTTGTGNVAVGYQAGYASTINTADVLTTGSYNTLMGYQASVSAANLSNATAIGYQAIAPASNSITLGNTAAASLYLPGYSAVGSLFYTSLNNGLVAGLAPGAAGYVLQSTGTASVPAWVYAGGINSVSGVPPIYITTPISPSQPVVNIQGLPNNSDMGGVLYSQGSGVSAIFTPSGTLGEVLQSNGTLAPTWVAPTAANAWNLVGNTGITYNTNYIGTQSGGGSQLEFKVNGAYAGVLDATNLNVYFGAGTGNDAGSATQAGGVVNVGIGWGALASVAGASGAATSGHVAVGYEALNHFSQPTQTEEGTPGNGTVAVGAYSLYSLTTPTGANTALGYASGYSLTTGNNNNSFGYLTNYWNQTGTANTAVGDSAMFGGSANWGSPLGGALYTGANYNTAVGVSALSAVQTGATANTAVGYEAATHNTTGNDNTAVGYRANYSTNSGANNTAVGYLAGYSNTTGTANVGVGYSANYSAQTAYGNVAIGSNALYSNTTSGNTAVGTGALQNNNAGGPYVSAYVGGPNVAVGDSAMYANVGGVQNVVVGWSALTSATGKLASNDTAVGNTAIGYGSMAAQTDGLYNTSLGVFTMNSAPNASYCVAIGFSAMRYNNGAARIAGDIAIGQDALDGTGAGFTGNYDIAIGSGAMQQTSGSASYDIAIGIGAGYSNGALSNGNYDVALGYYTNVGTTQSYNTAIGYEAVADAGTTSATGSTALGASAQATATNATAIGAGATASTANTVILGSGANVGIGTNTPAQELEVGGTANTIRVDGLASGGTYNQQIASTGNIVYTNNTTGDLYSLPNGTNGQVLSLNASGVPTWSTVSNSSLTTYSITGNTGTSVVVAGGNLNSVVGSGNVTLDVQGTAGGVFYGIGLGTAAAFSSAGTAGYVLTSGGAGAPTWTSLSTPNAWSLTGNSGTTPGTDFVGTTTAENLMFKVNGVVAGSLDYTTNDNAYFGYGVGVNGATAGNGGSGDYGSQNVAMGTEAMGNIPANGTSVSGSEAIGAYAMYDATASNYNSAIGVYSQYYNAADYNVSVGAYTLYSNSGSGTSTGFGEVALGHMSMYGNGTEAAMGNNNTAIGSYSLYSITTGGANTAVGSNALYTSTGGRNTAVGDSALVANTNGEYNTAVGYQAGSANTIGAQNTLLGYNANLSANNLSNATVLGYNASALTGNSVTLGNTAVTSLYLPGYTAVGDLLYTSVNTGLVSSLTPGAAGTVLSSNGTGLPPTWISVAGVNSVTGTAPIYITNSGPNPDVNIQGLPNNSDAGGVLYSTGSASSAVFTPTPTGGYILVSAASGGAPTWQNPAIVSGSWTLSGNANATATSILGTTNAEPLVFEANSVPAGRLDYNGGENAYYGYGAGTSTGDVGVASGANVGVGLYALGNATGASLASSEAIGAYALYNAANVYDDVAMGAYSQFDAASYANVSVGAYSLYSDGGPASAITSTTGEGEVALGHYSMFGTGTKETMGNFNTAIGYYSLYSGTSTLSGGSNTAVGSNALFNTTAGRNTGVGDSALVANTAGEFNTAVGYQALTTALTSGANYNTALGYLANVSSTTASNATAVGANALASANNTLILGAINGVNGATISATGNPGITNVGIGTNAPDVDAAIAVKTGHIETQVSITGATSGITDPASGNLTPSAITITGTDVGGNLSWVEGSTTTPTSGAQVQISFINAYATGSTPTVILTPANLATAQIMGTLQPYVSASSNTGFTISFAAGSPVSGTTYSFNYFVIETQ